ncbi:MAG: bifunctional aspartate kinase/homoserine dehydrogenase II [Shewanella sp.]|nr:bifunctional aspartate kinase/homoserine dehydrogenase II [Shewanella sp.]MCF1430578.1 bifunctional aspartate kinase/homoserine dehydrogenase II [Shewanella sp.]MCF1438801.1 bifunctional aspartate kinase/homoserine dehydrogenase II [Shewanella sp.]MCF1458477.1 bifunctional aspartate kinase/homoserine dehydrogenase II [Shewanella sp.]
MGPCHLHKFGGSSLADADCYRRVVHILLTHGHSNDLVVVSAAGKTTNFLYKLLSLSDAGQLWQEELQVMISNQQTLIEQLLSSHAARLLIERLLTDKAQLVSLLSLQQRNEYQINQAVSFGERWSARLLAALLREQGVAASDVDATSLLIADEGAVPHIRHEESCNRIKACLANHANERLVITGFICANEHGNTLLLGRNGSDFSATLIASLANIARCTIWTDVEGVFNADPNKINDATLLTSMSLEEADRLARLGSPVLHSRTLQPLFDVDVSLAVRSSYAPHTDFTLLTRKSTSASAPVVTSLPEVALLSLQLADGADELLSELDNQGLTALASWKQGQTHVSLAYTHELAEQVGNWLKSQTDNFAISSVTLSQDYGLVALVSSGAHLYRRSFARLLSRDALPVYQDGLSLVTLVPSAQVNLLTQKVHRRCAGPRKRIGVVLLGTGNIGKAWIDLFQRSVKSLNTELEASVELLGLVSSRKTLIREEGITFDNWQQEFDTAGESWNYPELLEKLTALKCDELVTLDISASASLTLHYPEFFDRGIHIVSANKLAGSGPLAFYRDLKRQLGFRRLYWRHNATCGAGLPVQHALNDLHNSGDRVEAIGGIFSGTLSWLFEQYDGSRPFSELVLEAKSLGITEPDPRDDLSGLDMQRKLLILAREIGLDLELEDIELDSLVPEALTQVSLEEFLARIDELNEPLERVQGDAREQGRVIRYVAQLEMQAGNLKARVALEQIDSDHPYANLTPGDNVFVIRSVFYQDNPLIIRGPGAGREVTAAAVQSDLAHICWDLLQEQ